MKPFKTITVAALMICSLIWSCGQGDLQLTIRFARVDGLTTGDRVILDESAAGQVTKVAYENSGDFSVKVAIAPEFSASATQNSRFTIVDDPGRPERKAVAIILLAPGGTPLADDAVVEGSTAASVLLEKWQKGLDQGVEALARQLQDLTSALQDVPLQEAVDEMKNTLADLHRTMVEAEEATREKIRRDILPQLQREIERLREALRAMGREDDATPLEEQLEEIRQV
jgi:paraquat-inducible protein B